MSRLNWSNVAAPDFSTSLDGIRTAGSLLDQAFNRASSTIEGVDGDISSRVNKAVLAKIAGISSAEGAEGQIQQLLAGVDPRRLNTSTIEFGAGRPDALINREADRFTLATSQYNQGRAQDQNERMDAAEPLLRAYYDAAAKGDQKGMAESRSALVTSGLRSGQLANAIGEGQDIISGDQGIESSRFGMERGRYTFGREQMSDADNDAAASVMADLQKKGLVTIEDASSYVSGLGLNPRVQNAVMGRISPLQFIGPDSVGGGGMGGGEGVDTSGGSQNSGALRIMNYEARGKGYAAVPASVQTLGQASDWAKGLNQAGVASSAMGVYQIVGQTMRNYAPKVLGEGWRDLPLDDFANQDAIAKAIFEDHKGSASALSKQWVSLSPAEAERVRKLPWEQARQVIARKESGSDPSELALLGQAGQVGRMQQRDTITGDPVIDNYGATVGQASSIPSVAARLTGAGGKDSPGGLFAGVDRVVVENTLRDVTTQARAIAKNAGLNWTPNADQAALLLENSLGQRSWGDWASDTTGIGRSSLGGRSVDDEALEANVLKIAGGQAETTLLAQGRAGMVEQRNAAAQNAYNSQAQYVQKLINSRANPQIIARERGKLAMLEQGLTAEIGQQYADGDIQSRAGNKAAQVFNIPASRAPAKLPSASALDIRALAGQPRPSGKSSSALVTDFMKLVGR